MTARNAYARIKAMKRRSATPVSVSVKTKSVLVGLAVLMAIAVPVATAPKLYADKYDDRINAIQREIDQFQAQAAQLRDKGDTLQVKLDALTSEKAQIQGTIDLSQAQFDKLQAQIKQTLQDIEDNKDALGEIIANLYIDGKVSPLEMLASSKNIGDYVDKQEYQTSVREELTKTIDKINDLKTQLEKQKADVEVVLANQTRARDALSVKEAEQAELVRQTRGEEAAYQQLINSGAAEQNKLREQQSVQRALEAAQNRGGGVVSIGGSSGGYPWNQSNCSVGSDALSRGGSNGVGGDGWGYGCRQCASYVAWRIGQHTGFIPTYVGDAVDFRSLGPNGSAKKNSVGIMTYNGRPGHVVWVETDPDAAGYIIVAQYNYFDPSQGGSGWGHFTRMKVHKSTYDYYVNY